MREPLACKAVGSERIAPVKSHLGHADVHGILLEALGKVCHVLRHVEELLRVRAVLKAEEVAAALHVQAVLVRHVVIVDVEVRNREDANWRVPAGVVVDREGLESGDVRHRLVQDRHARAVKDVGASSKERNSVFCDVRGSGVAILGAGRHREIVCHLQHCCELEDIDAVENCRRDGAFMDVSHGVHAAVCAWLVDSTEMGLSFGDACGDAWRIARGDPRMGGGDDESQVDCDGDGGAHHHDGRFSCRKASRFATAIIVSEDLLRC